MFCLGGKVFGTTHTVNNNSDAFTPPPGSLRKAIQDALDGDLIIFSSSMTILLSSELTITKTLVINGDANNIVISGNNLVRIFNITNGSPSIKNLTLTNGRLSNNLGAAIAINGVGSNVVTFENLFIKDSETNYGGGGIYMNSGNVTMNNVTTNNCKSTNDFGGGIYQMGGALTMNNCTLFENQTPGSVGVGAGIYISGGTNTQINNCTIVNNSTSTLSNGGGGVYVSASSSAISINNSIILDNKGNSSNIQDIYVLATITINVNNSIYSAFGGGGTLIGLGNQIIPPASISQVLEKNSTPPFYTLRLEQAGSIVPYLRLAPRTNNNPVNSSNPSAIGQAINATANDIRGAKRKGEWVGGVSDIGAWESMVVGNNGDNGGGTIRDAVDFANNNFGNDKVYFDLKPYASTHTILLQSSLVITAGTAVDGYTQSGATPATIIAPATLKIEVKRAGTFSGSIAFNIQDIGTTIKGLCINNFSGINQSAIRVNTTAVGSIDIQGNYIGTDIAGATAIPNYFGIVVENNSRGVNIGGVIDANRNIISGNSVSGSGYGIFMNNNVGTNNTINGNYIGTDASGTAAIANNIGILSQGSMGSATLNINNNLISGNTEGMRLVAANSAIPAITVKRNKIGTKIDSTTSLPNGTGIFLATSQIIVGGTGNERNIIAHNGTGISSGGTNNQFIRNQFFCNTNAITGIGNGNVAPVIVVANTSTISGTCTNCTGIDLYEVDNGVCTPDTPQGKTFIQSITFASTNTWSVTGTFAAGKKIVALAQDVNGTSRFSNAMVVNTPPTTINTTLNTGQEDVVLTFALGNISACFSDADGGDALNKIRIITLPNNATLKLSGNNVALNDEILASNLSNLTIAYDPDFNGNISFTFKVSDGTDYSTTDATLAINVAPVNDAPTISSPAMPAVTYTEGNLPIALSSGSGLVVTDVDNTTLASALVTISANYQSGQDVLSLSPLPAGITSATFDVATGALTILGNGTLAQFTNALQNVTYQNTSQNPIITPPQRIVTVQVNDGQANSGRVVFINVVAVNNAPVLSTTGTIATTFNEVGGAIDVIDTNASFSITDFDNTTISSFNAKITSNYENGSDVLLLSSTPTYVSSVSFIPTTGGLQVTFSSPQSYSTTTSLLKQVQFNNTSENPTSFGTTPTRIVSFQVNDGETTNNFSNIVTQTINIIAINNAPVIIQRPLNAPFEISVSTNEDTAVSLSFDATDADNTVTQLTWSIFTNPTNGTITPITTTGFNFAFAYTPNQDYFGNDSFVVRLTDAGGLFSEITVNVTVNAVNDAPNFTLSAVSPPNTQPAININASATIVNISGIDFGGGILEQTASLGANPPQTLTFTVNSSNPTLVNPTIVYTSPNATATLTYRALQDVTSATNVTITVRLADNGSSTSPNINIGEKTFIVPVVPKNLPPTNFSAVAISNTQINLSWIGVTGNNGYEIQRSLNSTFTGVDSFNANVNAISYDDGNLANNTQYYYRIRTLSSAGVSDWSETKGAETADVSTPPTNLVATPNAYNKVTLTWSDNSQNEEGFSIERASIFTNNFFEEIAQTDEGITTYIDNSVLANATYKYRVRAINPNGSSPYSNIAPVTTPINANVSSPNAPINVVANAISTEQTELTWEYNLLPNIVFIIERRTTSPIVTPFDTLEFARNDINSSIKFHNDTTITPNTTYCYRIRAIGAGGVSAVSNETCVVANCNLGNLIVRSDNPTSSNGNANISIQVCTGKSASLLVNKNVYKGNYQWKRNGVDIPGAKFRNYFASETGLYTCSVSLDGSCNGTTINSAVVDVSNSSQNIDVFYRFANGIGTLRASVTDAGVGNYQWFKDYQPLQDSTNYFIRTNTPGTYFVTVKDNGCASTSDLYVLGLTALENTNDISQYLKVSPNPAETDINITLDANIQGECMFYLVDMQGRKHFMRKEEKNESKLDVKYSLDQFAKGFYFLEIQCGKYIGRKKIIKL